jgi:hypothetical protein
MTKATMAGGMFALMLVLLVLAVGNHAPGQGVVPAVAGPPAWAPSTAPAHEGLLYGRVTMDDGTVYEGRLRFGGDEEALWSHYFNGRKNGNRWADLAPAEELPKERLLLWDRTIDLGRPFMARLGDIARIDARGRDYRVTLKSGSTFDLARFEADDLADGLRVWDGARGVVDLGEWRIRSIEFMPAPGYGALAVALHGTVRTRQGDFTGLVQWNRRQALVSDELVGESAAGRVSLRFETIRSIARRSDGSSMVTLLDGREIALTGTHEVGGEGQRHGGIYVDDPRYGRVLVSWDAFERVDFTPGATGPDYDDFAVGRLLTGSVTTRSGRRIAGRLVYDLDESETTETLDAPRQGVDYTIPFGHIASITLPDPEGPEGQGLAVVTLRSGEELELERAGDLGGWHGGILIFVDGGERPEYVPWTEVARVEL